MFVGSIMVVLFISDNSWFQLLTVNFGTPFKHGIGVSSAINSLGSCQFVVCEEWLNAFVFANVS